VCGPSLPLDLNTLSYTYAMQRTGRAIYAIILSSVQKSRTDGGNGGIYDCSASISALRPRRCVFVGDPRGEIGAERREDGQSSRRILDNR